VVGLLLGTVAPLLRAAEPPAPGVTGLTPSLLALTPGATGTATVTLSPAPPTDTLLAVASSDPTVAFVPASVVVPAGAVAGAIPVTAGVPGAATVTVTLPGSQAQLRVTVTTGPPAVVQLRPPVLPLTLGSAGTLTVTLSASQPTDTVVALTTSDAQVISLPADRVTVPAGARSAEVPVTGLAVGAATVTASLAGSTSTAAITVQPPPPTLAGLACPAAATVESVITCTLSLIAAQPTDTDVPLASSDSTIVTVPERVTVPAGTLAVAVPLAVGSVGSATLTAGPLHDTTQAATLTVLPPPPALASLLPSPARLGVGAAGRLTLTLTAVQPSDTVVPLVVAPDGIVNFPATVTIPAGALEVGVSVVALAPGQATLTAGPLHGSQAQASVTVTPRPATVTGLTPPALELPQGTAEPLTVAIAPTQPEATTVPLASSDPTTVEVPASIPVPAGEAMAPVPVIGRAPGTATITAGPLQGSRQSATVTVRPPDLRVLTVTPTTVTLAPGQTQAFTATGTFTDGHTADVTAVVTWISSSPTVATITAGGLATALTEGMATLTAQHPAGRTASALLAVASGGLTVSAVTPSRGQVGDLVTVTGTGFVGSVSVTFNGARTSDLTVTSAATLTVTVPSGATTGPVAVTTVQGTALAPGPFTVLPGDALGVTVAPIAVTTVPGAEAVYTVNRITERKGTGLVTLAVTGLPPGATALLSPPALGPNQDGTLSIQTTPHTPAGVYPISLRASGALDRRPTTTEHPLTLTVLAGGQTVLTGRILDTHRRPIPQVTIQLVTQTSTRETVTDAAGSFLLQHVPAGEQLVLVDGHPASHAQAKYPTIPVTVTILPGLVNRLPFTPHLHAQKDRNFTPIHPTRATVVTDPELPGVALRIPAGAKIIGWDGQPNTKVSIHTVPIDRLPVAPVPAAAGGGTVYMFYFGKRGGGTASQPIPFEAPNEFGLPPGGKATLWYFDESHLPGVGPNAWRIAGPGTVTPDGRTIATDAGVGIPKFCCGAAKWATDGFREAPKLAGPTPQCGQGACGGTDVDLGSGIFTATTTDQTLPGRHPVRVSRTYRSGEPGTGGGGPFGVGTTLGWDDFVTTTSPTVQTYIYAGNAATTFLKQADGTYTNTTVPAFRGARLTINPDTTRTLRFKDGRRIEFDITGFPVARRDRAGNTVTIERDPWGSTPVRFVEPSGRALSLSYFGVTGFFPIAGVTDPLGRQTVYGYDGPKALLLSVTDPAGGVTQYAYDAQRRMTSITDPRNTVVVQNTYDANSRVCQQTRPDTGTVRYFYITTDRATLPESLQLLSEAAAGGPITQTPCSALTATSAPVSATVLVDPRGKPTTYRFNGQQFLIQVTDALGQVTTYDRQTDTNLLLSITDPLNRVTQFQYDATGNVTQLTDAANQVWTATYEPTFSQVTSLTDPLGNLTTFEYDTQGNLTAITAPEENLKPEPDRLKTRLTYNSYGQVLTVTDPLNHTTTYAYTAAGDVATVTDPLGHTTTRTYDNVSRLVTSTDPLGRLTWYTYDLLNRLSTVADPLQGLTRFTYDANGNLLTVQDPLGQTTTHTYNSLNRLATRTDPLNRTESFAYDLAGNLSSTTDRKNQTTTYTYDALNRRTAEQSPSGTLTFTYDAVGNLLTATDPGTGTVTRTYEARNQVASETTPQGSLAYTYDLAGRRQTLQATGLPAVTYGYDANSRLTGITQDTQTATLGYDPANRRTILALPNGITVAYTYDEASRLISQTYTGPGGPLGDLTYQYDTAGNQIATGGSFARTLVPAAVTNSTYDAGNQQLAFGSLSQTFDANGNLLTQTDPSGTTTYTWDARNRLTGLTGPTLTTSFAYDALGRRMSKMINGTTTTFLYDGLDIVGESSSGGDVRYLRTLSIDEVLTRSDGSGTTAYLADILGSTVALTTGSGTLATTYTYEPFGRTEAVGTPSANAFQYTGRENDGTGLYYYRSRYYDPTFGRFISEDPIGFSGGINIYVYVGNSPLTMTDPFGLDPWWNQSNSLLGTPGTPTPPGAPNAGRLLLEATRIADIPLAVLINRETERKRAELEETIQCAQVVDIVICFSKNHPLGTITIHQGRSAMINPDIIVCRRDTATGRKDCCPLR
jgi:RHS repeat-associated protein